MDRALLMSNRRTSWRAQNTFRDGLIIALLALVPLRRRTLASLRIGKHLKKSGGQWFLDIPAEDVKTGRPLEYPIAPELSQRIDIYVDKIRPKTAGARTHDYLWASSRGRPMQGQVIYNAVREHTRRELGIPVNLQRFRRAAATLWSVRIPRRARCQGPARSCLVRDDGEVLHHGAIAPCRARSGARHCCSQGLTFIARASIEKDGCWALHGARQTAAVRSVIRSATAPALRVGSWVNSEGSRNPQLGQRRLADDWSAICRLYRKTQIEIIFGRAPFQANLRGAALSALNVPPICRMKGYGTS